MKPKTVDGNTTIKRLTDSIARKAERGETLPNIHRVGHAVDSAGDKKLYHIVWIPLVVGKL